LENLKGAKYNFYPNYFTLEINFNEPEFMQYLKPVGGGPSSKT